MAMRWALLAFGVIWVIIVLATVLAVRARRHQPPRRWDPRRRPDPDRFDRLHKKVAHYRASGALPRWDP
jgi:hypothetical protein